MNTRFTPAWRVRAWAAVAVAVSAAVAPPAQAQSRGELLYSTHCIACHTTQMHWRDEKLATDWNSLKAQVQRWQRAASLNWSEDDVLEVTRHLNERIYRFPPAAVPLSAGPAPRAFAAATAPMALTVSAPLR